MIKQNEFNEKFKAFGIDEENLPDYSNAKEFSMGIKKCSVLQYANPTYSNTTGCHNNVSKKNGGVNA